MQKLNEIIKELDGKPVSKYTLLYGRYTKDDIVYYIKNIYGGQIKYCSVDLTILTKRLFGEYTFLPNDVIPICSHILREFSAVAYMTNMNMQLDELNVAKGCFMIYKCGQKVLPNSIVKVTADEITISLDVKLPFNTSTYAGGSTLAMTDSGKANAFSSRKKGIISDRALRLLLYKSMPQLAEDFITQFNENNFINSIILYRNQQYIRAYLLQNKYVAFVRNGAILPRRGKTDYKDVKNTVPFISPLSMELNIHLPSGEKICGMGIKQGVTIITGDAYHGKSTIINAIQNGIYNHVNNDGREYVITDSSAQSIKAEDGRSIKNADISFFLTKLPIKSIDPYAFSTDNASGSTSQATAVFEAIESGCKLMLFDEDRSANNFMYKDEKMKAVIKNASTRPFIDNARMLYREHSTSSIMVVGASGEYFKIADSVILFDKYIASEYTDYEKVENIFVYNFKIIHKRIAEINKLRNASRNRDISILDSETINFGNEKIKVTDIIPNATRGQLAFVGSIFYYLSVYGSRNNVTLTQEIDNIYRKIDADINVIRQETVQGFSQIEYVRKYDIICLLNRLRLIDFTVNS